MTFNDRYIRDVLRTESCNLDKVIERIKEMVPGNAGSNIRLLHAALGMMTETGEIVDILKKNFFYGKPVDRANLKEEIGDLLWYVAVAIHIMDESFEGIMDANIRKLKERYPDKFDEHKAVNRNLEKESEALR